MQSGAPLVLMERVPLRVQHEGGGEGGCALGPVIAEAIVQATFFFVKDQVSSESPMAATSGGVLAPSVGEAHIDPARGTSSSSSSAAAVVAAPGPSSNVVYVWLHVYQSSASSEAAGRHHAAAPAALPAFGAMTVAFPTQQPPFFSKSDLLLDGMTGLPSGTGPQAVGSNGGASGIGIGGAGLMDDCPAASFASAMATRLVKVMNQRTGASASPSPTAPQFVVYVCCGLPSELLAADTKRSAAVDAAGSRPHLDVGPAIFAASRRLLVNFQKQQHQEL